MKESAKTTRFKIIVGLPGSGKTTFANSLLKVSHKAILLDDLSRDFIGGVDKFNEAKSRMVIITDPRMCGVAEDKIIDVINKHFKDDSDSHVFDFYYFANDPEACIINSRRSPKPGGTENFIRHWTKHYTIPKGAVVLPVYRG